VIAKSSVLHNGLHIQYLHRIMLMLLHVSITLEHNSLVQKLINSFQIIVHTMNVLIGPSLSTTLILIFIYILLKLKLWVPPHITTKPQVKNWLQDITSKPHLTRNSYNIFFVCILPTYYSNTTDIYYISIKLASVSLREQSRMYTPRSLEF